MICDFNLMLHIDMVVLNGLTVAGVLRSFTTLYFLVIADISYICAVSSRWGCPSQPLHIKAITMAACLGIGYSIRHSFSVNCACLEP